MIAKQERKRRGKCNPTSREIRRRCEEVRKRWSPTVERRRRGAEPQRWYPPVYSNDDFPDVDPLDN